MKMWWRWRRYPGRGPWSDLPPWERPGWKYGRGRCWWWMYDREGSYDEVETLEEYARFLEEELRMVRRRLEELRRSQD